VRSSMLESRNLTSTPPSTPPAPGATEVVEAPTAEAAIAAVHASLGANARIVDARRVLRGGIGGFFAKEVVQLHAAPGASSPVSTALDHGAVSLAGTWGAVLRSEAGRTTESEVTRPDASPVDRLLDGALAVPEAVDFATFLRRRLAEEDAVAPEVVEASDAGAPLEVASSVAPFGTAELSPEVVASEPLLAEAGGEPSPATDGGPAWSVAALLQLGLPVELVRSLQVAESADDLAWTTALAEALRPSCRPLPTGPAVMLGPHAHLIGEVEGTPAARSETWLKALRGGRWLHLVVGGDGWRAPLADQPLAASWARAEDLPDALRCAVELGLVLGFGPLGGRIRRARPLDVALAVRDLVDVR
jgi:hypothetical protein